MSKDKSLLENEWPVPRGRRGRQSRLQLGDRSHESAGKSPSGNSSGNFQQSNFHLSVKVFSRAKGQSATAAAAYRAAALIVDERTGDVHDYRKKQRVEFSEIVAPAGAPSWVYDRSILWNEVEKKERVNGCVAREWQISIPRGFSELQAIGLARELSNEIVDRHKIAVEFSIHKDHPKNWDGSEKGAVSYHAHILGTTRRITQDGLGEKSRELDDRKPQPDRNNRSRGQEEVMWWRSRFSALANHALERAGRLDRVDHRSNLARGIAQLPQPKLGSALTKRTRNNRGNCDVIARWNAANEIRVHLIELSEVVRELLVVKADETERLDEVRQLAKQSAALRKEKSTHDKIDHVDAIKAVSPAKAKPPVSREQIEIEAKRRFPEQLEEQHRFLFAALRALAEKEAVRRFPGDPSARKDFMVAQEIALERIKAPIEPMREVGDRDNSIRPHPEKSGGKER